MNYEVEKQVSEFINSSNLVQMVKEHPALDVFVYDIAMRFSNNLNGKLKLSLVDGKLTLTDTNKLITLEIVNANRIIYNEESYKKEQDKVKSTITNQTSCFISSNNLEIEEIDGTSYLINNSTVKHCASTDEYYFDKDGIEFKTRHNYGEKTNEADKLFKGTVKAYENLSKEEIINTEHHSETVVDRLYLDVAILDSFSLMNGKRTRITEYKSLMNKDHKGLKRICYTPGDDDIYKLTDSQIENLLFENNDEMTYNGLKKYVKDRKDFERIKNKESKMQM